VRQRAYILRQIGAELLGTYALVTAGCGAIIVNSQTGSVSHMDIALTFGLVITVMIAATGHLSGAHFNPAVTLAFAFIRRFPWDEVPLYISGQLAGAVLGALTLFGLFGLNADLGATVTLDAVWGGPISGASMNPARPFGPALVAGIWSDQWIYWLGPIIGAVLGALLYQVLRLPHLQAEPSSPTVQLQIGD
jgi:aquaporin NIP